MIYRNTVQIMSHVLANVDNAGIDGLAITHIIQKANISHSRLNTFLENLTGSGLINTIIYERSHTYVLTPRGLEFLEEYKKFVEFAGAFGLEM